MGVPPVKIGPHPYLFFDDCPKSDFAWYGRDTLVEKFWVKIGVAES